MPRKSRIDAPGALHHIIIRGIERKKIFRSDYDRSNFVGRLAELVPETQTECFAWALIPNHAHLLFRTGSVPVSRLMSRLLTVMRDGLIKNTIDTDSFSRIVTNQFCARKTLI